MLVAVAALTLGACASPEERLDKLGARTDLVMKDFLSTVMNAKDPDAIAVAFDAFKDESISIGCEQAELLRSNPELTGAAKRQAEALEANMITFIQSVGGKMGDFAKDPAQVAKMEQAQVRMQASQEAMLRGLEKCAQE